MAVTCVLLAYSAAGSAEPSWVELSWSAPPGCPSRSAVVAEVIRLAAEGRAPETPLEAWVELDRADDSEFILKLRTDWHGVTGERVLRGRSCRSTAEAAVLILALMLNPESEGKAARLAPSSAQQAPPGPVAAAEQSPMEQQAPPGPVAAVSRQLPPRSPPPPAESSPMEWSAVGLGGVRMGVLPNPAPAVQVGLGGGMASGSVWLVGGYSPVQHKRLENDPSMGGRLWLWTVGGYGCWSAVESPLRLDVCAGAELRRVAGRGEGVSDARSAVIYWTSPLLGVKADWPVSRHVSLCATSLGALALARPKAFLEDLGVVYQPPLFGTDLLMGVVITAP